MGQVVHDLHHHTRTDGSRYAREDCPIYAALEDGAIHRVDDEVFWHKDGHCIPVEYTSTPIWDDGKIQGAVVMFHDITERKRAEKELRRAYDQIAELKDSLERERDYLREEVNVAHNFGEIVGESAALQRVLSQIEAVAGTPANVLILGESGTGKELVARAIHRHSPRASGPLIKVNCPSIPKELFESEFFGHVKGAFTGAHRDRTGRFQLADGGTLFLDEISEIPLELQNVIERAMILSGNGPLRLDLEGSAGARDEPVPVLDDQSDHAQPQAQPFVTDAEIREQERRNLAAALDHAGWQVSGPGGAAELLGLKPTTLNYRIKAFGLHRPSDRS